MEKDTAKKIFDVVSSVAMLLYFLVIISVSPADFVRFLPAELYQELCVASAVTMFSAFLFSYLTAVFAVYEKWTKKQFIVRSALFLSADVAAVLYIFWQNVRLS